MWNHIVTVSADEILGQARRVVTPELRRVANTFDPVVRDVIAHHFGWEQAGGGGKLLRAALTLTAAAGLAAPQTTVGSPAVAVPGAVAVELLHNFSLLHDDIMDRDTMRRQRPTAWTVFGVGPALLAGDALFAAAFGTLADIDTRAGHAALRRLVATATRLLAGQAADVTFGSRWSAGVGDYERMAAGKTASLLSCAMAIGAELAGAPSTEVDRLAAAGHHAGLAFQAVDDVLGIWGDPAVTGKDNRGDLREGKLTLPILIARDRAGSRGADLRHILAIAADTTDPAAATAGDTAATMIEQLGGRSGAAAFARTHIEAAEDQLAALGLPPPAARPLTELLRLITDRLW